MFRRWVLEKSANEPIKVNARECHVRSEIKVPLSEPPEGHKMSFLLVLSGPVELDS